MTAEPEFEFPVDKYRDAAGHIPDHMPWRDLLVWDTDTGEYEKDAALDFDKSAERFARHDGTTARAIWRQRQGEFFSITDVGRDLMFYVWDGRIWAEDKKSTRVHTWVAKHWEWSKYALDAMLEHLRRIAEEKAESVRVAGGTDAQVKEAYESVMKPGQAAMKPAMAYWEKLGNNDRRNAVMSQLMRIPEAVALDAEFDSAPALMVLSNGVVDFSAAERIADEAHRVGAVPDRDRMKASLGLMPHNSERKVTIYTPTDYDPAATCPIFEEYLQAVLPDPDTRAYLQRALGAGLLGQPRRIKLMINLIGPSNTGKTVLLEVLNAVLGMYCRFTMPSLFLRTKGKGAKDAGGPSPDLHRQRRSKYVVASEPDSEDQWNGGLLKLLTGGEEVTSRTLYQTDMVDWVPRFLIVIASNFDIKLDTKDEALLRRIAPVKFEQIFRVAEPGEDVNDIPENERADTGLTQRILESESERSGVINWLIDGLLDYLVMGGVGEPEGVASRRVEMKGSISNSYEFVYDLLERGFLVVNKDKSVPKSKTVGINELHAAYETWCDENDYSHPKGRGNFSGELATDYSSTKKATARPGSWGGKVLDRLAWWCWETWYDDPANKDWDPYTRVVRGL